MVICNYSNQNAILWIHFQTIENEDTGHEQLMLLGSQRVIVRYYLLAIGIGHFQNSATRK